MYLPDDAEFDDILNGADHFHLLKDSGKTAPSAVRSPPTIKRCMGDLTALGIVSQH